MRNIVKIRLKRCGTKGKPIYRIVIADSRSPRDGKIVEEIGSYNPRMNPASFNVDREKATKWIAFGAQPTDTVGKFFLRLGITEKPVAEKTQPEVKE